jgi:hypothetical protein
MLFHCVELAQGVDFVLVATNATIATIAIQTDTYAPFAFVTSEESV